MADFSRTAFLILLFNFRSDELFFDCLSQTFPKQAGNIALEPISFLSSFCSDGSIGIFAVVDTMLKQMKAKGELNLPAYLRHVHSRKSQLIRTEEQYVFLHDILAEAVAVGETNIHRSYVSRYINSLQSSFTTDENSIPWQLLDRQFKLATAYQPQEEQFSAALSGLNQNKNRNFDYLPTEAGRVFITPFVGIESSDYINASWLPGFNCGNEYIITQHPTEQTVLSFWQMIWEHSVKTVVVLSPVQQPEFGIFWPNNQSHIDLPNAANVRVKLMTEREHAGFQTKDFSLLSLQSGRELNVVLVFSPGWPALTPGCGSVTSLTAAVQTVSPIGGVVAVVDRFGGTEAATFCALTTLLKQLDFESHVDVYDYAKTSHLRRPGVWRSQDEYFFLYRVFDAICASSSSTATASVTSSSSSYSPTAYEESSFQTFQPVSIVSLSTAPQQQTMPRSGTTTTIVRVPTTETVVPNSSSESSLLRVVQQPQQTTPRY